MARKDEDDTFTADNYHIWSTLVQAYLISKDQWKITLDNRTAEEFDQRSELYATWLEETTKALSTITLLIGQEQLRLIEGHTTAYSAWIHIKNRSLNATKASRMSVLRSLFRKDKDPETSMRVHVEWMLDQAHRVNRLGGNLSDEWIAQLIILSVPFTEYRHVIAPLEAEDDQKEITSERVIALLLEEDRRLQSDKQKRPKQESSPVASTMQALVSETNENSINKSLDNNWTSNKRMKMNRKRKFHTYAQDRCSHCNRVGHSREGCWLLIGFPPGHPAHNATQPGQPAHNQQQNTSITRQQSFQANIVQPKEESYLLITSTSEFNSMNQDTWWIDSGATHHYCPERSWFSEYHDIHPYKVRMGDHNTATAVGIGSINYTVTFNGERKQFTLRNVVYVPTLRLNLLSVPQLDEEGIAIHFVNHKCHITDRDGNIMCTGAKHGSSKLYYVQFQINHLNQQAQTNVIKVSNPSASSTTRVASSNSTQADEINQVIQLQSGHTVIQKQSRVAQNLTVAGPDDNGIKRSKQIVTLKRKSANEIKQDVDSNETTQHVESSTKRIKREMNVELWHQRLGHLHVDAMKTLQNRASGLEVIGDSVGVCLGCVKGKIHKSPKKSHKSPRATQLLGIIHSDVCGPMSVESHSRALYFVTFIDCYSRYIHVYFIHSKDQVFSKFVEFKQLAENFTQCRIKILRSDNGGEYISKEFNQYLVSHGISRQLTIPNTPELNGVAERVNRTIVEMARSMLYHANLPMKFWAEAVNTAVYLRNRCPTKALTSGTPYESWTGNQPNLQDIRVFGCVVYIHLKDNHRTKWESKAIQGIMLGYSDDSVGYRVWIPTKHRIFTSRDIVFDETNFTHKVTDDEGLTSFTEPTTSDSSANPQRDGELTAKDEEVHSIQQLVANRRSERNRTFTVPYWHQHEELHANFMFAPQQINNEPNSYLQAIQSSHRNQWEIAMRSEIESIHNANTWTLVPLPYGRQTVGSKWIYKIKRNSSGEIDKFKARLVAQGYSQQEGVDFHETYAPVAKFSSIRGLLALVAWHDLHLHQMDVNTAFLNGDIDCEVYMEQPQGFVAAGQENLVCKLNKSIYGLKQASRLWYQKIDSALIRHGFHKMHADQCMYYWSDDSNSTIIWLTIYVDDLLIASNSLMKLNQFKERLSLTFAMKDMGEAHFILGIQIERDRQRRTLTISQRQYIQSVLERFGMADSKAISTPMDVKVSLSKSQAPNNETDQQQMRNIPYQSAVGAVMYCMLGTRPDIAYSITTLSQFNQNPGLIHWQGVKRVLRYLKGTVNYGITYSGNPNQSSSLVILKEVKASLSGYCDADWGGNPDRRSISGYVFLLAGGAVSWAARKQPTISLSSVESEYIASCQAGKEALWWRQLLGQFYYRPGELEPTVIYADSQGSIALSKNEESGDRTKHIDIKWHWIREKVKDKLINFNYVPTSEMAADILTKALPKERHNHLLPLLGIQSIPTTSSVAAGRL